MESFLYLLHGAHDHIQKYNYLGEREHSDLLKSTWDQEIEGAYFFPKATWAEGRNGLYAKIKQIEKTYDYYIFIDDDVVFKLGDFSEFERQLSRLSPAVATPVFVPKSTCTVLGLGRSFNSNFFHKLWNYQVCTLADAQMMAFHKDVIADNILFPLKSKFDPVSWWFTSSTQQILMHTIYKENVLQINSVAVVNELHRKYPKQEYENEQTEWFRKQFKEDIFNPRPFAVNLLSAKGVRYALRKFGLSNLPDVIKIFLFTLFKTITYKKKKEYLIPEERIRNLLFEDSELYNQYLSRNDLSSFDRSDYEYPVLQNNFRQGEE